MKVKVTSKLIWNGTGIIEDFERKQQAALNEIGKKVTGEMKAIAQPHKDTGETLASIGWATNKARGGAEIEQPRSRRSVLAGSSLGKGSGKEAGRKMRKLVAQEYGTMFMAPIAFVSGGLRKSKRFVLGIFHKHLRGAID